MTKLVKLEIANFRGIKSLTLNFDIDSSVICLIGRGDSCKSTILEAISAVLSSSWNLAFHDTDFFNCDYNEPIEILAYLVDLPLKLLTENKFGLHLRGYDKRLQTIISDVLEVSETEYLPVLTIKLRIDKSLEPSWTVIGSGEQDEKMISSSERGLLSCYMISDQVDKHFSWTRGNPLYSLLKESLSDDAKEENVMIDFFRDAKKKIDEYGFSKLEIATKSVVSQATSLGLNLYKTKSTIDFKEIAIKDGKISLHEDIIPFRLKGKGSKRLASIAVQLALIKNGGIMLIDEIEQGLEPDRVKHVAKTLKESKEGQIFISSHSREVVTELGANSLYFLVKDKNLAVHHRPIGLSNEELQKTVRSCPEAFFAKKVIVCEGATEVGICRALDQYRKLQEKESLAYLDCAFVDGSGSTMISRATEIFSAGFKTLLFCDSDLEKLENEKNRISELGIKVVDCDQNNSIEQQVFLDLNWSGVQQLLQYVLLNIKENDTKALEQSVSSKCPQNFDFQGEWLKRENIDLRKTLGKVAKEKEWFKRMDLGEAFGRIIFENFDEIDEHCKLKEMLISISEFVDR